MSVNIEMPKLSDTMTEGTLIKWHKSVGDSVEIGDVIAEVETDKATMEMEAFDDGVLTEILVPEGDKAPIGAILAVLDGDDAGEAPAPQAAAAQPAASAETPPPVPAAAQPTAAPAPAPAPASGERVKASPLARKIATDLGIDLSSVAGSGPAGRITKADVEAAKDGAAAPAPAAAPSSEAQAAAALSAAARQRTAAPAPAPAPAPAAITPASSEEDEIVQLSTMRKVIAERLLTSKTTIPHFYLHLEVDAAPLMALRKQINTQTEATHGNKYSLNDFVLKAVINAAMAVPAVNASFAGDHIVNYKSVGLSVAIAVDDGLVTPVIKQAESKSLLAISREVKDFAVRARDKKLKPNEFDGGTVTVSNLGAWGIESFDAIVNPPQATILSVGAIIEKPVVKDGQVVPGMRMNLGLSCDHRVVDGAIGAQYLAEIKKLLEQPALMLL
ncbi:MAG: pyruvate dehydrogenase complex dihydrolipoamide acetyltransferase [Verrucomicrobiales bacterium]|nr:pyruvate dehydrogenase complex dihydrolipoamide acetyltransferase [Verrucomicrobiota bacterium JB025]